MKHNQTTVFPTVYQIQEFEMDFTSCTNFPSLTPINIVFLTLESTLSIEKKNKKVRSVLKYVFAIRCCPSVELLRVYAPTYFC